MIGIDPTTLSRVERGKANASANMRDKIKEFLLKNLPREETG